MKSKTGKIVSKKSHAAGNKAYAAIKGLERGGAEGAEGLGSQRVPGREEGLAALYEGQGALRQVSASAIVP